MTWAVLIHPALDRELEALPPSDGERVLAALRALRARLTAREPPGGRAMYRSEPIPAVTDLRPFHGTGVPASYRLRVGPYRVAVALLPETREVLATAVARRSGASYRKLKVRHQSRIPR